MTRARQPWPRAALWALEDVTAYLEEIDKLARQAQELVAQGKALEAVILLGDVRDRSSKAAVTLRKGKDGER